MRTLNLSGFQLGDNLNLSVSQGALTAGPVNVPAWGGGGDGGTITIVPERTDLQVAPDSVRFTVDLSASTFDTVPGSNPPYDARLHDLIYLWDMDDTAGDWTAPINVLAAWKDRNVAKGPFVAHMYTQPGTYNPSVLVIEPSSGKTATAVLAGENAINVLDPDVVFAGAKTICVSTSGNFAGAPAGAATVTASSLTTDAAPYSTYKSTTEPRRWLLRRGESFSVTISGTAVQRVSFGAFGSGAKPIVSAIGEEYSFNTHSVSAKTDIRLYDFDWSGTFDPTEPGDFANGLGHGKGLFTSSWQIDLMVSNVNASGVLRQFIYHDPTADENSRVHADNCVVTDFGGQYTVLIGASNHANSSVTFTGVRMTQNPNAIDGNNSYGSPLRIQGPRYTHMRGCDIFTLDKLQRCVKLIETPESDGLVVNVHSCSLEGGLYNMSLQGNPYEGIGRTIIANAVIDGIICVGTYSTVVALNTSVSGYTVRNCLFIQPGMPKVAEGYSKFIAVGDSILTGGDLVYGAAPIRIYNNTGRMDRTTAQNGTNSLLFWEDFSAGRMTNIVVENNLIHAPNLDTPQTAFAPLSEAALWTPRCIGYKATDTLDTSYATPVNAVKDTKPLTGSAALGAALSGNVSYMDILGTTRTAPADKGAWEAA